MDPGFKTWLDLPFSRSTVPEEDNDLIKKNVFSFFLTKKLNGIDKQKNAYSG